MCARRITASRRSRRAGPSSLRTGVAHAQEGAGVCGRGRSGHGGWPDVEQCGCPDGSAATAGAVADRSLHRGRAVRSVLLPPAVCCAHRGSSRFTPFGPSSVGTTRVRRAAVWRASRMVEGPGRPAVSLGSGAPGGGPGAVLGPRSDDVEMFVVGEGPQRKDRRGRGGSRAFVVEVLLEWPRLSTLCSGGPAAAWASR